MSGPQELTPGPWRERDEPETYRLGDLTFEKSRMCGAIGPKGFPCTDFASHVRPVSPVLGPEFHEARDLSVRGGLVAPLLDRWPVAAPEMTPTTAPRLVPVDGPAGEHQVPLTSQTSGSTIEHAYLALSDALHAEVQGKWAEVQRRNPFGPRLANGNLADPEVARKAVARAAEEGDHDIECAQDDGNLDDRGRLVRSRPREALEALQIELSANGWSLSDLWTRRTRSAGTFTDYQLWTKGRDEKLLRTRVLCNKVSAFQVLEAAAR